MCNTVKIWALFAVVMSGQFCHAYRILLISPIPSGSHAILGDACVKSLLDAGHEVVYVTAVPKRIQSHPKFVEVDVSSNAKYFPTNLFNLTNFMVNNAEPPSAIQFMGKSTIISVETVKHEAVQRILNDGKKFDLVIAEWMFSEIYSGLPALLDCPLVWLSTMEPHGMILSLIDEYPNAAYNADFGIYNVAPFSFFQRVQQLWLKICNTVYREFYIHFKETYDFETLYAPMMQKIGKKMPSYQELRLNGSMVLSNSHVSLGQVIRLPPNFISIGGYHIDPEVKPLPENLKKVMDGARHGVIYFSMGSILRSKDFPQTLKTELVNMFGGLKQTVLWKFEEVLPNLPSNVHMLKWASQQSILAHPNCVLFVTHGGLLSITESIHYAVPVIGVPVFADQFLNIKRAEKKGFAKKVDLSLNLAKDLKTVIEQILDNPRYKEKVEELSFVYHNRPMHPRKELVHWVEHVIETRGAPLFRSLALQMPLYQKFYLDLAMLALIMLIVIRIFVKWVITNFTSRTLNKKNAEKLKKKIK